MVKMEFEKTLEEAVRKEYNPEKFKKAIELLDKKLELEEKIIARTHLLKLGLWQRFHVLVNTDFERLKFPEKEKLFNEYKTMYEVGNGKTYEYADKQSYPSYFQRKNKTIHDWSWKMNKTMEHVKKEMDDEE